MGWKLARVELCGCERIKPNEEKDICIILDEEDRAVIHGTVKFPNGKPAKGATVKLFKGLQGLLRYLRFYQSLSAFTDDCGQFLFGVEANTDYVIKSSSISLKNQDY